MQNNPEISKPENTETHWTEVSEGMRWDKGVGRNWSKIGRFRATLWAHGLQHTRLPYLSHHLPSLLKLMSIELVMPSTNLILCCPLFLLPSIFPSIRVFPNKSALPIKWPNYWSFSISPFREFSREFPIFQGIFMVDFLSDWLVWSSCCPRDSQESSPVP